MTSTGLTLQEQLSRLETLTDNQAQAVAQKYIASFSACCIRQWCVERWLLLGMSAFAAGVRRSSKIPPNWVEAGDSRANYEQTG